MFAFRIRTGPTPRHPGGYPSVCSDLGEPSRISRHGRPSPVPAGALNGGFDAERRAPSHQQSARWCAGSLVGKERHPPMILEHIDSPADLRSLTPEELATLSSEIRGFIVDAVTATGGHLGSNLGVVELTLALHRTFDSPRDVLLWDTGHQAYVHKLVTGRRDSFAQLRQADGLSGYPNRTESEHDWVENSHASTILSYAHGLASAFELQGSNRRVIAVVGDGALTGGMAYEALNNLGHSGKPVVIVLNDNGRSYAPTVSRLSLSLTHLRLSP